MPATRKTSNGSRKSNGRQTSRSGKDAIALLKQDHQKVRQLLKRFESNATEELLGEIENELKVHTQIEVERPIGLRGDHPRIHPQRLLALIEQAPVSLRLARDIFQRFLWQRDTAAYSGAAFELLGLPFQGSRQAQIVQGSWPEIGGNSSQGDDHLIDQLCGGINLPQQASLPLGCLATD